MTKHAEKLDLDHLRQWIGRTEEAPTSSPRNW